MSARKAGRATLSGGRMAQRGAQRGRGRGAPAGKSRGMQNSQRVVASRHGQWRCGASRETRRRDEDIASGGNGSVQRERAKGTRVVRTATGRCGAMGTSRPTAITHAIFARALPCGASREARRPTSAPYRHYARAVRTPLRAAVPPPVAARHRRIAPGARDWRF